MSEAPRSSATRGRTSSRGGRAGFGSRGGRGGRTSALNGDKLENDSAPSIEESQELIDLKQQYGSKVSTIREMFPDWSDEDAVYALQETDGALDETMERILDGV